MESYVIKGGHRLHGAAVVHGAKNSVLPILAACLCCDGVCEIHNCPRISDVDTSIAILRHLGCQVVCSGSVVTVDASTVNRCDIPGELMQNMRSSVLFLGALLARCGAAELVPPGGCALGRRPIDLHLWAMEKLGARCCVQGDEIACQVDRLQGCLLKLRCPSVGATENAMLASLGCTGTTTIENAAREPEIVDLARFLQAMGAHVSGAGSSTITIEGGRKLHGTVYWVMPDRIETATLLCAAAGCGGDVFLSGGRTQGIETVLLSLEQGGCRLAARPEGLRLQAPERLRAPENIITGPHPAFPTDAQALMMAAVLRAEGTTEFTETVFENRLQHVPQMQKLGASIRTCGCRAIVEGVPQLHGVPMTATDLRCGAALTVAALQAEGRSRVFGIPYIRRGYEDLAGSLRCLGAEIVEELYQ